MGGNTRTDRARTGNTPAGRTRGGFAILPAAAAVVPAVVTILPVVIVAADAATERAGNLG